VAPGAQRFWDGSSWTPHTGVGGAASRPRLPDEVPVYGSSIWLLALLPVFGAVALWISGLDPWTMAENLRVVDDAAQSGAVSVAPPDFLTMFGPGYVVTSLVSTLLYAALIVLAYRDWKGLGRLGVVRPFAWGWAFLSSVVYVIGRSVVVRKVASPRGLAPMWMAIAVMVITQVSTAIWLANFFAVMAYQLP